MNKLTIGLFGTCGNSTFRQEILIPAYEKEGIEYFNPQTEDWNESMAEIEADHLANDQIILFPVLSETYGSGSLSETGFSIAQAMRYDSARDFVFLIDKNVDEELKDNEFAAKSSVRDRALVLAHLKKVNLPNAYLVETIEEMLELSIVLYNAQEEIWGYREKYSLQNIK